VSARHVERGALLNAGASGPLFEIVITDPVRVYVQVPQSLVAEIVPGQAVSVTLNEFPGVRFEGTLTRSSGTLDPESRTMRVEVRVPNPRGQLLPGMYANVSASVKRGRSSFLLPATALIVGAAGTRVANVDADGNVQLVEVEVERDFGAEVEIKHGLSGTENIIRAPGPQIKDGARVQVASEKRAGK
jgi:RND family efflux transporter MFP subunit